MEIERKFLTSQIPFDITTYPFLTISQSYISVYPTIRIRQSNDTYWLTIKSSGHLSREEYELPLTKKEYDILLKKTETPTIQKKRYQIPLPEGFTAEVDIYEDFLSGLIITEVEFPSESVAKTFEPPAWFGSDITFDPRYKNNHLSIYGIPK